MCCTRRTHQHLRYTVLLPDIAEVPRHVGLEPDVFPIGCRLLEVRRASSGHACHPAHPSAPTLDRQPLSPKTNLLRPPLSTLLCPVSNTVPTLEDLTQTWPPRRLALTPQAHGLLSRLPTVPPLPTAGVAQSPKGTVPVCPSQHPSHSRSSPQCSGSAALARCTGPREQEEGVPGAGGPTW